jgi:hypothetical protein
MYFPGLLTLLHALWSSCCIELHRKSLAFVQDPEKWSRKGFLGLVIQSHCQGQQERHLVVSGPCILCWVYG